MARWSRTRRLPRRLLRRSASDAGQGSASDMLKNYILIALRRLTRERTYVLINIFSLALGIASFMILALYLRSELTYDRHQVNRDRIYRVIPRFHPAANAEETSFAVSQVGIGPLLTQDYPQIGKFVRFQQTGRGANGVS